MKVLDLFSGIGGFSLGLERAGFKTAAFCEIDPYCRAVLRKHWPDVPCYEDIRELTGEQVGSVDVICGGFPCQDISTAGHMAGMGKATRSGLWSEIARLTREIEPRYIIVENVANLLVGPCGQPGGWFGDILADLASIRYDAEWHCIRACRTGLPQARDRVWIVAYREGQHGANVVSSADLYGEFGRAWSYNGRYHPGREVDQPCLVRVADGFSSQPHRIRQLGNAVIPQIPEIIGRAIMKADLENLSQESFDIAPLEGRHAYKT